MDISFEEFDELVKACQRGEFPDMENLVFNGWNVEALVNFMTYGGEYSNLDEAKENVCGTSEEIEIPF